MRADGPFPRGRRTPMGSDEWGRIPHRVPIRPRLGLEKGLRVGQGRTCCSSSELELELEVELELDSESELGLESESDPDSGSGSFFFFAAMDPTVGATTNGGCGAPCPPETYMTQTDP